MQKRISFLLIVLVLLGCFSACGKKDASPDGDTTPPPASSGGGGSQEQPEETQNPAETLELPDGLNFDETIHILQRSHVADEMYAEKYTGELINDTIYDRNKTVEATLGVTLEFHTAEGTNQTFATYRSAITQSALADTAEYQIVANYAYFCAALAVEGVYHNLLELNPVKENYLNLDKVWWNSNYVEQAVMNDKLYFIEGDVTISAINRLEILFYNMNLTSTLFPDVDFLEVVHSGEWTYEYFLECVHKAGAGESSGMWGVTMPCNSTSIDGFIAALGVDIVQRNSRDVPEVSFNTDRTISIATALRNLYQFDDSAYADEAQAQTVSAFVEGNAIFHINLLQYAGTTDFKNLKFEYAVIPLPKWDELQEDYLVTAHDEYSTLSVPINVLNTDTVSAVMELMGYVSYTELRPALYERTYKVRYLKTEPKARMFDFIIDHTFFDFGYIYSYPMGNPVHVLRNNIRYAERNQMLTEIQQGAISSDAKLREFIAKLYE